MKITRSTWQKIPSHNTFQHWWFPWTLVRFQNHNQPITIFNKHNQSIKKKEENVTIEEKRVTYRTCPPTTATVGSASHRDIPSPPWSPSTVQARWILLMRPIKLVMVAILSNWLMPKTDPKKRLYSETQLGMRMVTFSQISFVCTFFCLHEEMQQPMRMQQATVILFVWVLNKDDVE